jgi:hypothetical protein
LTAGMVAAVGVTMAVLYLIYGPAELRRERREKGLCVHCGYDLTGNVSGVCPECGDRAADPKGQV